MGKSLIIVESPTKIKTLRKFLRGKYLFESSLGHIRDLPEKRFGIDVDDTFDPEYEVLPGKKDVVARLKKVAKECDTIYLAPDPDREGEAIAWHISELMPKKTNIKRITFNAITKAAVQEALEHPREIDEALVNAQQARRLLDRIVGYKISPILSRKIQRGREGFLSAGRVQSVALKLVVDREREIEAFKPTEYWTIEAELKPHELEQSFKAYVYSINDKKVEKLPSDSKDIITIADESSAKIIVDKLQKAKYHVKKIEKKEKKRNPVAPFITSTLQQEASRHYGFTASRTMGIAQSLYEGIDLGNEGAEGLITYMRTDSVRIEPEAEKQAQVYIKSKYGQQYLPPSPPKYSTKKSSQDAHEAIRPTHIDLSPEKIKKFLQPDQYKLYKLIWRRFLASQMKPAIYDTVSCDIQTDQKILLKASGSTLKFKGFLIAYQEKYDSISEESNVDALLPPLKEKQKLDLLDTSANQSFTKPPPRFTEASLVKELEKQGIGRPSTYATIMNKIQSRDYTIKEKKALKPTELGKIICAMLETNFSMIMDIGFTADMEEELDHIADENKQWKTFLKSFWKDFKPLVDTASKEAHVPKIDTDIDCPKCGAKLQKIWAKNGYFYGCSSYPECDFTSSIELLNFDKADYHPDFDWDQKCPKCKKPMVLRSGKFGVFLGCSDYPNCNGIVNVPKKDEPLLEDLPKCPAKGCPGHLVTRRSRFGKQFFACSTFPDCDVIGNSIEEVQEKYKDHPRTAYKGKGSGKGRRGKLKPNAALKAIIGSGEFTRGDITKKLWEYIKENDLQDSSNRRKIVPDKKLAKLFGSEEAIDMMKLAGIISKNVE